MASGEAGFEAGDREEADEHQYPVKDTSEYNTMTGCAFESELTVKPAA